MPAARRRIYGPKFTRARTAAEALCLDELRQLDDWLHDRIATAAPAEKKKQRRASRVSVEERKTPTGTYQLELVNVETQHVRSAKVASRMAPIGASIERGQPHPLEISRQETRRAQVSERVLCGTPQPHIRSCRKGHGYE